MQAIDKELISRVKATLYAHAEAGNINDALLITWSEFITQTLGIGVMKEKQDILEVEDRVAYLPKDFKILWSLHKCKECNNNTGIITKRYYDNSVIRPIGFKNTVDRICYDKCDIEVHTDFVHQRMYIETQEVTRTFCERSLLSISKKVSKDKCNKYCPNLYSNNPNIFDLTDKELTFNFDSGVVHIQYHGKAIDEDGYPMVDDENEYDMRAYEAYLIYKVFLHLYYNSEADVQQKMMLAERNYKEALADAKYYHKLTPFKKMVAYGQMIPKSLEMFNLPSYADRIQ